MKITIRTKRLKNGSQSVYLDYYQQGKRKYEFLNLYLYEGKEYKESNKNTLELANQIRIKREYETNAEILGIENKAKKVYFLEYCIETLKRKHIKTSTAQLYKAFIYNLKNFDNKDHLLKNIDKLYLEKFISFLIKQGIKSSSIKTYISILNSVLNNAIKENIIKTNPLKHVEKPKVNEKKREHLTTEQLQKLANTETNPRYNETKRAFLFSCFTGLRYSDVKNLTFANIKDCKYIEIRQQKTADILIIPLSGTAKSILEKGNVIPLNQPPSRIFRLKSFQTTLIHLNNLFKACNIDLKPHFHTARHTFAVLSISLGIDFYTVSKLLGHKDLKTTQIYAKVLTEQKEKAIEKLPNINII